MTQYANRAEAGKLLALELGKYAGLPGGIVLALPRGGVPVGFEVAKALKLPLDVFPVRKLGAPGHEELAFGAIAPNGYRVINPDVVEIMGIRPDEIQGIEAAELRELRRRMKAYRGGRPELELAGRTVILVDDGMATGASMQVAVNAVRSATREKIVVATPTASNEAVERLGQSADEVISLLQPRQFFGVGAWYTDFRQTTDAEVVDLLAEAATLAPNAVSNRTG